MIFKASRQAEEDGRQLISIHLLPQRERQLRGRRVIGDPRIVDEQIEPAELLHRRVERADHLRLGP